MLPIKKNLRDILFFQRPLKIQKHLIGGCEFEKGHKRVASAMPVAQAFRFWQNLNNLKITFNDGTERFLNDKERLKLAEGLTFKKQLSWEQIRKLLDFPDRSTHFNLERVRKTGLLGNQTATTLSKTLANGVKGQKLWQALGTKKQEQLTNDLLNILDDKSLIKRLREYWQFNDEQIERLVSAPLAKGYLHISQKAARNILEHMSSVSTPDNKGLTYDQACEKAGYEHTKPLTKRNDNTLLYPGKAAVDKKNKKANHAAFLSDDRILFSELRNPMVERTLYQVRRVVNTLIKKYGKPDIIRVEMARDMKASRKNREDADKRNKKFEKLNNDAKAALINDHGIEHPSRADIIKYRLWQECNHECPYTGKTINADALLNGEFEVEHIIPYSRCLNDSYMNKTLCHTKENTDKGNRTPGEFYSGDEERYKEVLQRAGKLPHAKFKRFALDAVNDMEDFVSQQLNETRYISKQAVAYLMQLGVKVEPVKGGTTALLRRSWQLNNVLGVTGEKNRDDHRHHAIDALAVSLTNRSAVRALSTAHLIQGRLRIEEQKEPMPDLRQQATQAANNIIVSHKTNHKIAGALHKEFIYGITGESDKKGVPEVVIRKPVSELSKEKDIERIRDPQIRRLAYTHLQNSKNFKDAFNNPENPFGMETKKGLFLPIKKTRMVYHRTVQQIGHDVENNAIKRATTLKPKHSSKSTVRHVWTRNNHHIAIFEYQDKKDKRKWRGEVVSMFEAATRKRLNQDSISKSTGNDNEKFVMAIHKEDTLQLKHKGKKLICRVQKFDQSGQIILRVHTDASKDKTLAISKTPNTLLESNTTKITVNVIGNLLPAYD